MLLTQGRMALLLAAFAITSVARAKGLPADCADALNAGDFGGASTCYQAVLNQAPNDAAANAGVGILALYANDLESAARHLKAAQNHGLDEARIARLLAQVQARRPVPGQYRVEMGDDPVRVPFVTTDPLPILKVRLNGTRDAYFLLDTGAGTVMLDSQLAKELGINAKDGFIGTFAGGKRAPVQRATLGSIALGSVTITNLPIGVHPVHLRLRQDIHIEGAIGTGLLSQFLATIDYPHGGLVLRRRSDSSEFEAQAARSGAVHVPLWLVGDHFLFARGRLGDAPEGLFMIDTGCAGCGVVVGSDAVLKAAHITPDAAHAGTGVGGGGAVTVLPFEADVTLGRVTEHAVRGFYSPQGSIFPFETQGSISHGFFRPYALTLDFNAMLLVMQK